MDSFVIAVLIGAGVVVLVFGLMIVIDKGKPVTSSATTPAKVAGKR
jgi:hypothetical protein